MASTKQAVLALLFVAVVCVASEEAATSEENVNSVKQLTSSSFEFEVNDGSVWFIKFFAPWCGHCKRLAPTWAELATALKDNESIHIAHVDCTTDREVCTTAEIKGYPTLKVYHKGEDIKSYRGERKLSELQKFIEEAASELLQETTE